MKTIAIAGFTLNVPDDYCLPQIRNQVPDYAWHIGRLAAAIERKYPGRGFVDAAAQAGEAAAIVRAHSRVPILCIEGSDVYHGLLQENIRQMGADIELERVLCDAGGMERPDDPTKHRARLDAILARHPRFQTAKILKCHADTGNGPVMEDALEWIIAAHPVLFWRFTAGSEAANGSGQTIFDRLSDAGYQAALLFDNIGQFVQTISLAARGQLTELYDYLSGAGQSGKSFDLCAFHDEDAALCCHFRQIELEHRSRRTSSKPLHELLSQELVQAQLEMHAAQVTSAVQETIKRSLAEAQRAELTAIRSHMQLDRNRLQLQIADLENRISLKDAEIQRLHALLRESLKAEDLKGQVAGLRHELDSSVALRAARSLHWILGPIRRRMGGNSNGGGR